MDRRVQEFNKCILTSIELLDSIIELIGHDKINKNENNQTLKELYEICIFSLQYYNQDYSDKFVLESLIKTIYFVIKQNDQ